MSIQSSPFPPPREYEYDVFLSFRGEDTRHNFVDHLCKELFRMGIHCYIDEKLQMGKEIGSELLKVIEQSRFSIVVFSTNYASSRWCLNELVKILECKATTSAVYPVFYHLDPSDVRNQAGDFGKELQKLLSRNYTIDSDEINRWREALKKVSNLKGWIYPSSAIVRSEAKFIEELVRDIFSRLDLRYSRATEYLVGMNSRVEKVIELLGLELADCDEARVIGIWGMVGSGKTTIAKAVCDHISWQFEGCSFIENVRETSKKERGLERLQEKLISDLLMEVDLKVRDIDHGRTIIRNRVALMKVLIVLDDVDSPIELGKIVGDQFWFHPKSRVIITTRDREKLVTYNVRHIYEVEKLKKDEAVDLFMKAYGEDQPTGGFEEVLDRAVEYAKGLPSFLKGLGSFLRGRSKGECISLLSSADGLPEQIDIKKIVKHDLINQKRWNTGQEKNQKGWNIVQEKSVRKARKRSKARWFSEDITLNLNKFTESQLAEKAATAATAAAADAAAEAAAAEAAAAKLNRSIAIEKMLASAWLTVLDPYLPTKPSVSGGAELTVSDPYLFTEPYLSAKLAKQNSAENILASARLIVRDPYLPPKPSGSGSAELFLSPNPTSLGTGSFTRLPRPALWPNLKYLRDISLVYCTQCQLLDFCYISRHLVFLEILCVSQNFATQQLDSWLSPPNLRVLMVAKCYSLEAFPENTKLPSSSISQLGHFHTTDEFMMVDRFQIDDFSFLAPFLGCHLTITPGHLKVRIESFQYIFEWMILDRSASLKCLESERHSFSTPSPGPGLPLEQLEFLSFRNSVHQRRELMHEQNVFLENLEINGCSSMSFPIKNKLATNLRQLKITNCTSLQLLSVGLIHNNSSLEMLHIQGCPSLLSFTESEPSSPNSASNTFLKLKKLEIWDCVKLKSLPLGLHRFSVLNILSISNCPRLVSFPEGGLPSKLTSLLIYECESLRFLPDNMHKLASLQDLSIYGCPSLTFFPEGGLPTNLVSLSVIDCENLCPLYQWGLHKLIKLDQFTVMGVCSHLDL